MLSVLPYLSFTFPFPAEELAYAHTVLDWDNEPLECYLVIDDLAREWVITEYNGQCLAEPAKYCKSNEKET